MSGITGLRGLEDQLGLQAGESLLIFGADGVALAQRMGAEVAVDGKHDDVGTAARRFEPGGFDAALVLVSAPSLDDALSCLKHGGRMAYPHGVEPEPKAPEGVTALDYDGEPSRQAFDELNRLISRGPFHVELGHEYRLEDAAQAHRDLAKHHLGKLAFQVEA